MKNTIIKKNKNELILATRLECLKQIRKYTKKLEQTFKPKKGKGSYNRKHKFNV